MKRLSYPASTLPSADLPEVSHHGVAERQEISTRPGDAIFNLVRDPVLWTNSLSQFQFFGLGALLALANHRRSFALAPLQRWLALTANTTFFLVAAYPFHFNDDASGVTGLQVLSAYLSPDVACALLFCPILNLKLSRVTRSFIYLGKISYGL